MRWTRRQLLASAAASLAGCTREPQEHLGPSSRDDELPPLTKVKGLEKLRLGLVPYIEPQALLKAHQPLAQYLTDTLGVPVEVVVGANYQNVAELLDRGEIELAEFSPYVYVIAGQHTKLRPLLTVISDGSETAAGYVLVRADNEKKTLEELKGGSFAFVDPASTSGYLFPMKLFKDRGIDAKTFFSRTDFLGNHEKVLLAIHEGRFDAGATYQGSLLSLWRNRSIDPLSFRVIAKTPRTPRDLFAVRGDFSWQNGNAIIAALRRLSSRDAMGRKILGPLNMNGFFPADDALYEPVRQAAALIQGSGQ